MHSMEITSDPRITLEPFFSIILLTLSHNIPGPYFGYLNRLIRVFITSPFLRKNKFVIISLKVKFCILAVAQSALILLGSVPQTFSVYVLKKIAYNFLPNLLLTHSSNEDSVFMGKVFT